MRARWKGCVRVKRLDLFVLREVFAALHECGDDECVRLQMHVGGRGEFYILPAAGCK